MLLLSDVHCDKSSMINYIINQFVNVENVIVAAGDWGFCDENFFRRLSSHFEVYTIYGNNDNIDVLKKYFHLIEDGEVVSIEGIKVGGINGIISPKGTPNKRGVPRKRPLEFLEVARELSKKSIDLLVLHEAPYMPWFFGKMWKNVATLTALDALYLVQPKVALVGHLHAFPCRATRLEWGGLMIHVDSSRGGYALLENGNVECGRAEPGRMGQSPASLAARRPGSMRSVDTPG